MLYVLLIIIAVYLYRLNGRVKDLEDRASLVASEESKEAQATQPDQLKQISPDEVLERMVTKQQPKSEPTGLSAFTRFMDWLKEDWLMKLGGLLILIGFGWFVTFAFLQGWIGPMGRIALGITAGVAILLLGWWRVKKFVHQGSIFLALGSTAILLTVFAAREIYGFFTPVTALGVMLLSTAFVALTSVKYKVPSLALASLVLAGIAPLLTSSPDPSYIGLFSYLLVVTVGALWVVALTGWRMLTTAALILITVYSLPHITSFTSADTGVLLVFAYIFAAIFFITNTLGILKSKDKGTKGIVHDLVTAGANGLLLLAWIMFAAPDVWRSLIIAAWMIVFTVGAFMIYRATNRKEPFYVYVGVGIAMLAAATSAELSGATLTIAYTIESGLIALIAYFILRDVDLTERISLLMIGPVILSVESIASRAWRTGVFHGDFFVLSVLMAITFGMGLYFRSELKRIGDKSSKLGSGMLIVGSVYAYILLWRSLHAGMESYDLATLIALAIYTIIGITVYIRGRTGEDKELRIYGGVLIAFVVGRLLIVEVWNMNLTGRIITFFIIGALLMSTAFIGRKKEKVEIIEPRPNSPNEKQ